MNWPHFSRTLPERPPGACGAPWLPCCYAIQISTALARIERGASRDIDDVPGLVHRGIVSISELQTAFDAILPRLETESLRVDEHDFRRTFEGFLRLSCAGERDVHAREER